MNSLVLFKRPRLPFKYGADTRYILLWTLWLHELLTLSHARWEETSHKLWGLRWGIVVPVGWFHVMASEMEWTCLFSLSHSAIHFHPPQWAGKNTICKHIPICLFVPCCVLKEKHRLFRKWNTQKTCLQFTIARHFEGFIFQKLSSTIFVVRG